MAQHETSPLLALGSVNSPDYDIENVLENAEEYGRLEKSLKRKLDWRMGILGLIYILNYIDRQNIAVARLRGFEEDLRLEGSQYATCLGVVYVGYLFMQIPSNLFLEYIGKPSIYLSSCMILWGFVSVLTGAARGFHDVLAARFCLGLVEAGFFAGALLLISKWYKRDELGERTAYLACGLLVANATGSLIASGILKAMDNISGISAWRWLFVVEGTLTVLVAFCALFILPDFPTSESSCKWLSHAERAVAIRRIQADSKSNESGERLMDGFWLAVTDWKVWWLTATLGVYAFASSFHFYFPTLVQTLGYGPIVTLLICVPPWLTATGVVILGSRHSDKSSDRFWHITFSVGVAIIGYIMSVSTMNTAVRYISFFLMTQVHSSYVCFMAWASISVSTPSSKRATALALINTGGVFANIIVPYAWPSSWGSDYSRSFGICIFASVLYVLMCWIFRRHLEGLNEAAKRKEAVGSQRQGYRYQL
ncbi:MFS general substrate transporter [Rhodocollybia butyracea]|uniref:MFS general substrate transporter n=1 Tax=Rhodocollybia butyracea TaxID=206335 RepID=A0A9P5Q818_9AGAR|nr:MFS general substrate transporter [Rhodocollybia butyracea]